MKQNNLIKGIAINAILAALTAVLTLIPIPIGNLNLNLGLIPIAIGAVLYGWKSGLFIGLVNGVCVLLSPATGAFFALNVFGTIIVCLLKTGLAGLLCGLVYSLIKKKNDYLAVICGALIVPIINTAIFIIGSLLFFDGAFGELISIFVTANFIVEFVINILFSPSVYVVVKYYRNKNK